MAVAPQLSPFEIVDLRHLRARELEALLEEEQRLWREELYWDYRPSAAMIRKHVDARSLPGTVALVGGRVAGYCFFVYEEHKALIGDLYVLEEHRRHPPPGAAAGVATLLLKRALETLERSPQVRRIEAQLIPCGTEPLAPVFLAHDFCSFPRLFLYKSLPPRGLQGQASGPPGIHLRDWEDGYFEAMAELIVAAYRGHVDSHINDQYSQPSGAMRFLKNIVIFPGCGVFQQASSLVAVEGGGSEGERLAGAVLTSRVAPGVAHVTQLCVEPRCQGRGLGRRLMEAALARLAASGYRGVSLTVTAENQAAVGLYRRLGFDVLKGFAAFARTLA